MDDLQGLNGRNGADGADGQDEKGRCPLFLLIREMPDEIFPSVAGEVMARLEVRDRRLATLRWGVAVGAAALAGVVTKAFGLGLAEYVYNVISRGFSSTGEFIAYSKLVAITRMLAETLARVLFGGALDADLGPYRAQIWVLAASALVAIIFLMYLMGLWLRQPRGVKSWHFGRLWHSGTQAW